MTPALFALLLPLTVQAKTLIVTHPDLAWDRKLRAVPRQMALLQDPSFDRKYVLKANDNPARMALDLSKLPSGVEFVLSPGGEFLTPVNDRDVTVVGGWLNACFYGTVLDMFTHSELDAVTIDMAGVYATVGPLPDDPEKDDAGRTLLYMERRGELRSALEMFGSRIYAHVTDFAAKRAKDDPRYLAPDYSVTVILRGSPIYTARWGASGFHAPDLRERPAGPRRELQLRFE